ncbi:enhancing lycopene biosynthesis protein 2 [Sinobacterium caligoides]|uniref:Glyoxalase n=1 Tax=Sinobacterium caligoides TaxID=933926 RepID=A0A3N2DYF7_9GAMM|nr:isoprenoid biosynthesis glyoxalase ElbB [Sinobacterium caligoides]ROS04883.1 enhancing lycopene biosynthesis protein 2 [Sinobacterium caligoides]
MTKFAVVLSGCGYMDGAEVQEAVLTLLHLDKRGIDYQCFAPNIEQWHVVNHLTGEPAGNERRNVLVESARIVRGDIMDLADAKAAEFDALIVPGGYGVAKNLSDLALSGEECQLNPDFLAFAQAFKAARKPIGLACISPALSVRIFGMDVECTIGCDKDTARVIELMGGRHMHCAVNEIHVDVINKLVTTPAYMYDAGIADVSEGLEKMVEAVESLL